MNDLKIFEQEINEQEIDNRMGEMAMIALIQIIQKPLLEFELLDTCDDICLVKFTCYGDVDPVMPIILGSSAKLRSLQKELYTRLQKLVAKGQRVIDTGFKFEQYTGETMLLIDCIKKEHDNEALWRWLDLSLAMPHGWQ